MNNNFRAIVVILIALLLVVGVCGGLVFLLAGDQIIDGVRTALLKLAISGREDDLQTSVSSDNTPVRFRVAPGDAPAVIAANLVQSNLILDAGLFVDYVRAESLDVELEAGTYFLNQAQTLSEIAMALTDSRFSSIPFTIFPGWRLEQVVETIDANPLFAFSGADFMAVVGAGVEFDPVFAQRVGLPAGASLEGFLYPNTYSLAPEITPEMLRDTLTNAFLVGISGQTEQDAAVSGYSLYEIVTMASIVQREAVRIDEMPRIAGVYFNRLNIDMKMDADPTVQYALGKSRGDWWAQITQADYQNVVSAYNTYLQTGLPPGPIANPSLEAIRAAIYSEESNYFYFRADCRDDGYHDFARTFDEHLANGC
ncbi:MAG: endolytic transglycosylase MltG [Anaerolineae bacterium]|nr:endolytic transglycosylase MltG [Anaerolineae bacterium]